MSKIERIKAETDGLDVLPELLRAAREGWETLSPDHVGLLKWYGLYAHNTGDGHFMMRVKVIQGKLTLAQVETMAGIAEEFGRGVIDCTTRQCFQIHWIRLENIVEIFDRLERVGMTTSGACGDITRNVVGCTLAGLAHDEVVDGYATSEAIHDYFLDNKLYSNLPRKYKVSVTGCSEDCARGLINDIALSGVIAEDGTRGFNLRVGGGLSTQPRFARWMDVFLTPEETPEVIAAMTGIFRDAEENRKARGKARLKFLVDRVGPEALREELETRVGRPLRRGVQKAPGLSGEDHIGVLPQADDRYRTVGMVVPVGRLRASQLQGLADLARKHGANEDDALRLTHQQNVLLPWIPAENVDALLAEPLVAGPHPHADALPARPADLHGQGVLRPGQGPHQEPRGRDLQVPGRARAPERPRRGLPPALRGLLVELRAAPDRRRRHRGRAQEVRGRVHRGDGHPHRRPAGREPAVRHGRGQEGPELGAQRHAAADLHPLRDAPRRGRDVPRLRGPDRARVVDAGAHPGRRAGRV